MLHHSIIPESKRRTIHFRMERRIETRDEGIWRAGWRRNSTVTTESGIDQLLGREIEQDTARPMQLVDERVTVIARESDQPGAGYRAGERRPDFVALAGTEPDQDKFWSKRLQPLLNCDAIVDFRNQVDAAVTCKQYRNEIAKQWRHRYRHGTDRVHLRAPPKDTRNLGAWRVAGYQPFWVKKMEGALVTER
jgi:hypothetical protein